LRHALQKHDDDGQRNTADRFLDTPAVDQYTAWNDGAERGQTASKAVFGDALAVAFGDPPLDRAVGPAAAEEGAEDCVDVLVYCE
jgi:hypothetical protein